MKTNWASLALVGGSAVASACDSQPIKAEMLVFSAGANPSVDLSEADASELCAALNNDKRRAAHTCRVMGFTGFAVEGANGVRTLVRGHPVADALLIDAFAATGNVSASVLEHVRGESSRLVEAEDEQCASASGATDLLTSNDCFTGLPTGSKPIVGPDTPPVFDLEHDVHGCWVTKQEENNCYNYGNDIVTNTFAQPGMGSGKKWTANTCEAIKVAAVNDGLVYIENTAGKPPPPAQPDDGHIVSMHIWPQTNFHWVRMDKNLTFSHKPGGTEARDVDNDGNIITDPSKANFAPWTQHCGYFTTIPSKVTIAGDR